MSALISSMKDLSKQRGLAALASVVQVLNSPKPHTSLSTNITIGEAISALKHLSRAVYHHPQ